MKILHLRDRSADVVEAWASAFHDLVACGRVTVSRGEIFDGPSAHAIVSPANSFGFMGGGIDLAYLHHFGMGLQHRLQTLVRERHYGELHVGQAVIVATEATPMAWLVSAPTMRVPMDVSGTTNAYLAMRAALIAVVEQAPGPAGPPIDELLCPGLCTAIGRMPARVAAKQMRAAWDTVVDGKRWLKAGEARASQYALVGDADTSATT